MTDATVQVTDLGAGGDGVGRLPDGRAVFVPRTAPGDQVRLSITQERERFVRAELVEVVREGPGRRTPPCPLYASCGGCALMHLDYDAQLSSKQQRVRAALTRIGGVSAEVEPILPSPQEFRYRNRLTYHLRRVGRGRVVAGFHQLDAPGRIVDVPDCLLANPALQAAWTAVRAAWGAGAQHLPDGPALDLVLRSVDEGTVLTILGGSDSGDASVLMDKVPGLRAVWWKRRSHGVRLLAGDAHTSEVWNGEEVLVGPSGFLQANRQAADQLWDLLVRELGPIRGRRMLDAYCGAGIMGRLLARHGAEVVGIELDPDACRAARNAAPEGFTLQEGRVEALIQGLLPVDVALLNPPRQGLHSSVVDALVAQPPSRIVYVSCDPATLARDLGRMADVYEIVRLQALDFFPQTPHVEALVTLSAKLLPKEGDA